MPGLLGSGAKRVESKLSKTQNTRANTQNQSRSPKASRKISNMNILSANNIQSTDYLKHASKQQLVRFIQDPVAVAGTNDDLYMDMRNPSSVAAMPKKPGDIGTERRNPVVFDK